MASIPPDDPHAVTGRLTAESRGMLLGLLGVTAFGITLPATRLVVVHLDPVFIGLGRAVVAALVAALLLRLSGARLPSRAQFGRLAVVALGAVVGFPVLSAKAMATLPASHGGVMLGVLPLLTAAVGALISHERPSPRFWLFAATGSALVIGFAMLQGFGRVQPGDLYLLAAAVAAAVSYAFGGMLSREMEGWKVICWALLISLPFILWPALRAAPASLASLPAPVWVGFLYLALVSQLGAFFWWNRGLALGGVARVSQVQLLQPFVTILAAALLLGEAVEALSLGFAVLVATTVAIGRRAPIRSADGN